MLGSLSFTENLPLPREVTSLPCLGFALGWVSGWVGNPGSMMSEGLEVLETSRILGFGGTCVGVAW